MRRLALLAASAISLVPALAAANEVIEYTYDARGRLVTVVRSGTVHGVGVNSSYTYDRVENRTNLTIAGSVPSFTVSDPTVVEGGTLSFVVTKGGTGSGSVGVSYASANGTATAGTDYTAASGTLTFSSSETTKTVTVGTTNDAAVESNETVLLNLTSPTGGATISDSQGIGTITDNDVAPPSFSISNEGGPEGETLSFTVLRSGSTAGVNAVSFATAHGTTNSLDFDAASGTLTFAASETSKTISIYLKTTGLNEPYEEFYVNLTSPTNGATISDAQGLGMIDEDSLGGLSDPGTGEPQEETPAEPGEGDADIAESSGEPPPAEPTP